MGSKQSDTPYNFEENVRKTGKRIPHSVEVADTLGQNFDHIKARTQEGLTEETSWATPGERSSPNDEHNSFLGFIEDASRTIEDRDNDLQSLEEIHGSANAEAYNAMLGLADGKEPERALQSDERVVDHMRQGALKADEDRVVANRVRESVSENIDTLEQDLLDSQEALNENLNEYADEFENYMQDMAAFTRDEYGAMAELTNQLSEIDEMEVESDLGETVINHLEGDLVESLESQTRKVADAYNEMVEAYESTERLEGKLPSGVRARYAQEHERLEDALQKSEQIFDNMAGCYDSFPERAEAMMSESLSDTENLDPAIMEAWENDYSQGPA